MSKYLHFGQISPTWLALEARKHSAEAGDNVATFIEELLVRRELSMNFVHFRDDYDCYESLPAWARQTLTEHRADPRPYLYTRAQLEAAETHDPYWNAAMREMRHTGYMHNYMRMYWGKKILEWSVTPEEGFAAALAINNRYFLDGRDANSFANIAWVFGQHDRPWGERPIFGKVRYMNARGLERKCDIKAYVSKVERLTGDFHGG
jgi:deoxyribodipyrimidine photo-lyase